MRCPACGATNSDRATWCTQCFTSLTAEPPAPTPAHDTPAPERDIRTRDGEVEWRCATCGSWNALAADPCGRCGAPRRGFGAAAAPRPVPAEDRARLLALSAVLPGLGHLAAGRVGTGAARAVLAVTWLAAGVLLVVGPGGVAAAPPIVGVLLLWVGSMHDVDALVHGRAEVLTPRRLAGLTGVVIVALVVALVVATGAAGRGG